MRQEKSAQQEVSEPAVAAPVVDGELIPLLQ
jgi:hypothetical protein